MSARVGQAFFVDVDTGQRTHISSDEPFYVGRSDDADLTLKHDGLPEQIFVVLMTKSRYELHPLSGAFAPLLDGEPVQAAVELTPGSTVSVGKTELAFELITHEQRPLHGGNAHDLPGEMTLLNTGGEASGSSPFDHSNQAQRPHIEPMRIDKPIVVGRSQESVDFVLANPQVSRVHATLTPSDSGVYLRDHRSANGTYINGTRVSGSALLRDGDRINIGPYALRFERHTLSLSEQDNHIELTAQGLTRTVNTSDGGKRVLLNQISFGIRPGEFVCVLGPSGSGKSTLLNALSARAPANDGAVLVNGQSLYQSFDALKSNIALVHQRDAHHEVLTVAESLTYTSKLRLPTDTSANEAKLAVDKILETVGMTKHRDTRISHLSGGQIKRVSLATELLANPALLFLDEVTSGLDEQTDLEMMRLFRTLATEGRTVLCITHSLASVELTCHLVVILTVGGRLAFIGTPKDAIEYFKVERLGEIYAALALREPDHWEREFRNTRFYLEYVVKRQPGAAPDVSEGGAVPESARSKIEATAYQARVLLGRYAKTLIADKKSLLIIAIQAILVAGLIALLFGSVSEKQAIEKMANCTQILFLMGISCLWFGCSNAAKEIVKERVIYDRERDASLNIVSYFTSKIAMLSVIAAAQAFLLFIVVRFFTALPADSLLLQLMVLILLSFAGTALGLLISACSRTVDQAQSAVPLVLIPQIILSNVIAEVTGLASWIAHGLVTLFWGFRGLGGTLWVDEDLMTVNGAHQSDGYSEWSIVWGSVMLLIHAAVFAATALWWLYFTAQRNPSWGQEARKISRLVGKGIRGIDRVRKKAQSRPA